MRSFLIVWLGQLVSLTGSALSQFALGVWVFERTASPTLFALGVLCAALPRILLAPLAGALVDRWDRRRVLIAADVGASLITAGLLLAQQLGALAIWHVFFAAALAAACGAFQRPAYTASISVLIPPRQLGRAAGLVEVAPSTAAIVGPLLAGWLLAGFGLAAVLLLDLATFLAALLTLIVARIPSPSLGRRAAAASFWREAGAGWVFIRSQPGLRGLLLMATAGNMLGVATELLLTPYVLAFAGARELGMVAAAGGAGLLAGGSILAAWGGPRRLVHGLFAFELLVCLCTMLLGLTTAPVALAAVSCCYFLGIAMADGCATALWQRTVPLELQGRVFALREAIAFAALPFGLAVTAPLAELVLDPLLGPGRGIALIFVLSGLINLGVLGAGWANPAIRSV